MKNEIDVRKLRTEHSETMGKACAFTSMIYLLIESADSLMVDVNSMLKNLKVQVSKEEKVKLVQAINLGKRLSFLISDMAKHVYAIDSSDIALEESDEIYDLVKLIMDRVGGDAEKLIEIKNLIKINFESKYGYYKEGK